MKQKTNLKSYDIIIATNANLRIKRGSLEIALISISKQTLKPNSIIIVNNGCETQFENLWYQNLCKDFNATYIEQKYPNRSQARNIGINKSVSEYIVFLDDDIILPPTSIEICIDRISQDYFCCGAHRRYLSMDISVENLNSLVRNEDWQDIDELANDQQLMDSGYKERFRHFPHQSAFISCFGIVPRKIALEVSFDENYKGWGLEDTDYMRRLLNVIGFRSSGEVTIYHIDHLVSPYIWNDHWGKNFELYLKGINQFGYLRIFNLFQHKECPAKSPEVLLSTQKLDINSSTSELPFNIKTCIDSLITEYLKDNNLASLVLTGSSLYSKNPKDLDIVKVVFSGNSGFKVKKKDNIIIEEQTISIPGLEAILFHPEWAPDTWLWIAGRYVLGYYLLVRINVRLIAIENVNATLNRRLCHLLTYHLGALVRLVRQDFNEDKIEGLRHIASILFLSEQSFPDRMKFPFTSNHSIIEKIKMFKNLIQTEKQYLERYLLKELSNSIINIIQRGRLEETEQSVFLTDCYLGLEAIESQKWGKINANWEKIFR